MADINECQLNKFFKRRQDHMLMFGYVTGQRQALPSVSVANCIKSYLDYYNIDGDVELLRIEYGRMEKDLRESEKS
jgi:hypothetical protein